MASGGSGDCRSREWREARPNPVSRTSSPAPLARICAGLRSLWTSPRRWSWPRAEAMPTARRKKRPSAMEVPSSRASGSPPGSSSTSMVRPPSRTSSNGRTAQVPSSSSFNPYSCSRRARLAGVGWSAAGHTASTGCHWPSASSLLPRPRTSSRSCPRTWKLLSPSVPNRKDGLKQRPPPSAAWRSQTDCATFVSSVRLHSWPDPACNSATGDAALRYAALAGLAQAAPRLTSRRGCHAIPKLDPWHRWTWPLTPRDGP